MGAEKLFKEKLASLITPDKSDASEKAIFRKQNRDWLLKSAEIALKIIDTLKERNWTQVELSGMLETSPQNVSKILKGRENLTLETIVKLERILNIELIAVPKNVKQIEIELPKVKMWTPVRYYTNTPLIKVFDFASVYTDYSKKKNIEDKYQVIA